MSPEEKAVLNYEIAEFLEPQANFAATTASCLRSPEGYWYGGDAAWMPVPFTDDWRYVGMLLEMMNCQIGPSLMKEWGWVAVGPDGSGVLEYDRNDPKLAICRAFKKWKQGSISAPAAPLVRGDL